MRTIALLGDDGKREEIAVDERVDACGVVVTENGNGTKRYYRFRSSNNFRVIPLFEEVQAYEHGVSQKETQTAAAQYLANHDVELDSRLDSRLVIDGEDLTSHREALLEAATDTRVSPIVVEARVRAAQSAAVEAEKRGEDGYLAGMMAQREFDQMPHQDVVAQLLFSSWADIGMRLGLPRYASLTAAEKHCVTLQQMEELAHWVAQRATVFCIRVKKVTMIDVVVVRDGGVRVKDEVEYGLLHAGDDGMLASEIDIYASAPYSDEARESRERIKRILSWPTKALAEQFLSKHHAGQGEVVEMTVAQLWEACRA